MKIIEVKSKAYGTHNILIDDEDLQLIKNYTWGISKVGNNFYAITQIKQKCFKMHRLILNITNPKTIIDHINHNGLDNRRQNIRQCTCSENLKNKKSKENSSSKYLGVTNSKRKYKCIDNNIKEYNYWKATININGNNKHLGYFKNEEDAAKAYDEAAKLYHKEFANLNFKI